MKDTLFNTPQSQIPPFEFNQAVTDVFDDMISRSIPFYQELQIMIARLAQHYVTDSSNIYDLGCSTGHTFSGLYPSLHTRPIHWIGIDNSLPMLKKAKEKLSQLGDKIPPSLQWVAHDISAPYTYENASLILLILTLQFIPKDQRPALLESIFNGLNKGGATIIVEKIKGETPETDAQFIHLYHQYKADRGYSQLEIAQKRDALENVLLPLTLSENITHLKNAGFTHVEPFFRWFNFAGLLAIK
jgi:tRNA (cmo5U34)-methyltransferase